MRPLVITEKVGKGEDIFGYLHGHLLDASKIYPMIHVICLEKSEHNLPANVVIDSLGKDEGRKGKLGYLIRLWKLLWLYRRDYDVVIVFLTPLFARAAAPLLRLLGKKIVLWYNHPLRDRHLSAAARSVHIIATPAMNRCPLDSKKCAVMPEGFNIERLASL